MTGLVRKATLLTLSGVLAASAAMANVPSSANSTIGYSFCSSPTQCGIYLTGSKSGVADPAGQFAITVRDLANNLIANSTVVVDFSQCVRYRASNAQLFAGLTVDNLGRTVRAQTNGSGVATFRIIGGGCVVAPAGNTAGGSAVSGACARIFADGVLLGSVKTAYPDMDGVSGVGGNDLAAVAGDVFGYPGDAANVQRSDYDFSGALNGNDLAKFSSLLFSTNSLTSGTYDPAWTCP
jgi:hypothetical protein